MTARIRCTGMSQERFAEYTATAALSTREPRSDAAGEAGVDARLEIRLGAGHGDPAADPCPAEYQARVDELLAKVGGG